MWRIFGLWVGGLLGGCAGVADPQTVFEDYVAAVNAHDLAMVARLTAPDARWGDRVGREALMRQSEFDVEIGIGLEVLSIDVDGEVVEATLVERSDFTRAHGPPFTTHHVRFVIRDGLVVEKGRTRPDPEAAEFRARTTPFRRWLRATHPQAFGALTRAPGVLIINRETGALTAKLLAEWVALGRPGLAANKSGPCAVCASPDVVPMLFGMLNDQGVAMIEAGLAVAGGCYFGGAKLYCRTCGHMKTAPPELADVARQIEFERLSAEMAKRARTPRD